MPGDRKRRKLIVLSDSDGESTTSRLSQVSYNSTALNEGRDDSALKSRPAAVTNGSTKSRTKSTKNEAASTKKREPAVKKEKAIYSFFNAATQRQRSNPSPSASPMKAFSPTPEVLDDIIQDDHHVKTIKKRRPSDSLPLRKKLKTEDPKARQESEERSVTGSQAFKRSETKQTDSKISVSSRPPADTRPWTDRYAPINLEELAEHKRKVQDVQDWLKGAQAGRAHNNMLILRGPAGSGKTQTLSILIELLGIDMQEWRNPSAMGSAEEGLQSMSAQFDDFMGRASMFGSLDLTSPTTKSLDRRKPPESTERHSIVVIEEFPSMGSGASTAMKNFRSSVLQYLMVAGDSTKLLLNGTTNPISRQMSPVVMVMSETSKSATTDVRDTLTAHRLLGAEIMQHPGVTVLDFNPIAVTFMTKALDLVLKKDARITGRRKSPSQAILDQLAELGDIRSAVSALEFICVNGDSAYWTGKIAFTKSKKVVAQPSQFEKATMEILTQRESAIGIFHSLGRVLYNKRTPLGETKQEVVQPPAHLPQFARPKPSEVDVDLLLNELGTDIETFVAGLHENYALSCTGIDEEETLDHIVGCMETLSDSDLLLPSRFTGRSSDHAGSQLRQGDLAFYTAVQGLLFHLPHPVRRAKPPPGLYGKGSGPAKAGSGGFQMYYPKSMQLWLTMEDNQAILESILARIQATSSAGTTRPRSIYGDDSVSNWRRSDLKGISNAENSLPADIESPIRSLSGTNKVGVLTELLPWLKSLGTDKLASLGGMQTDVRKLVSFEGRASLAAEEDDEVDQPIKTDLARGLKKSSAAESGVAANTAQLGQLSEKASNLILEDDDIEDD